MRSFTLKLISTLAILSGLCICLYSWVYYSSTRDIHIEKITVNHVLPNPPKDLREEKLSRFFTKYHCPKINFDLIHAYLTEADKNDIPYSLLPAISLEESSCARRYRYNNFWGWNSAKTGFDSPSSGVNYVTLQLGSGYYYAHRTLKQKLNSYNPNPDYYYKIINFMKEIE